MLSNTIYCCMLLLSLSLVIVLFKNESGVLFGLSLHFLRSAFKVLSGQCPSSRLECQVCKLLSKSVILICRNYKQTNQHSSVYMYFDKSRP